jgi:hypothetical protein
MTDEQISEIFAMGRESFFAGQRSFQVQAYPFRMTALNMAKHRTNPNMPFWKMIKQGYDHFEVTRQEPKVDVCEKRYVFNAVAPGGAATPLNFSPRAQCPVYEVPQDIWAAVNEKQRADELKLAQLTAQGSPVAPVKSGRDGGMHPSFIAKLQPREIIDDRGNVKLVVDPNAPGPIASASAYSVPSVTERDSEPVVVPAQAVAAADVPLPRNAPQTKQGVRPEEPSFGERIANLFRRGSSDTAAKPQVAAAQPAAEPASRPAAKPSLLQRVGLRGRSEPARTETPAAKPRQIPLTKPAAPQADSAKATDTKPAEAPEVRTAAAPAPAAPSSGGMIQGAQPSPGSSNFDNRWGAFR